MDDEDDVDDGASKPAVVSTTTCPSPFVLLITGEEGITTELRVESRELLCDWVDWLRPITRSCDYPVGLFRSPANRIGSPGGVSNGSPSGPHSGRPRSRASSGASDFGDDNGGGAYNMVCVYVCVFAWFAVSIGSVCPR